MKAERVLVADDEAANEPLMRTAMSLAMPPHVQVSISAIAVTDFQAVAEDSIRTLVLLRDIASAVKAHAWGLPAGPLNIGNVHAGAGRVQASRSVFLTPAEHTALAQLAADGMQVTLQAVPSEAALPL